MEKILWYVTHNANSNSCAEFGLNLCSILSNQRKLFLSPGAKVRDKNNAFYLTTSTSWPEYGPVAKGNLNLINKPGSNPLATSEVLVERPGHNPESFQVDMDSKYFGYMHYVEHHLEHFRRKPGQYTILYWAPNRWLEIIYTTNQTIEFNIWDYGGSKYIKPAIQIQDWEVKQAGKEERIPLTPVENILKLSK